MSSHYCTLVAELGSTQMCVAKGQVQRDPQEEAEGSAGVERGSWSAKSSDCGSFS